MTYARNKGDGTWRAHGRYLERESATGRADDVRGFGSAGDQMPIARTLDQWQRADDRNLFKLIVSPEKGHALDLREYTKAYMAELEKQLGTRLQWVAADHYNTDHPHVHVALRGIDDKAHALVIPREFIKGPLRQIAQDLATHRLGYRTAQDVEEAREKQISQQRFTDLDRLLLKQGRAGQGVRIIDMTPLSAGASDEKKQLRSQLLRRLSALESLGLARRGQGGAWELDAATETILRARQQANDRLKATYSHRAMLSDSRIPLAPTPTGNARIAGRLIGTGLDEATDKAYMLIETTGGSVVYLYQSRSAELARAEGLKPGDFLVVTQRETEQQGRARTTQFVRRVGPADSLFADAKAMREEVRQHVLATGQLPQPSAWTGWLGTFHSELHKQAEALVRQGTIREDSGRFEFKGPANAKRGRAR